jgi:hypothetical protein
MTAKEAPTPGGALEVRVGWRRDDPAIAADAIAFWEKLAVLPAGVAPAERAKELVAGLYRDGTLVAVATAVAERVDFLGARFLMLRSMNGPDLPRETAHEALAGPVRDVLEQWALDNPDEAVAGVVTLIDPRAWGALAHVPVWPVWPLTLVGYLGDGRQVRACWFDHYRTA